MIVQGLEARSRPSTPSRERARPTTWRRLLERRAEAASLHSVLIVETDEALRGALSAAFARAFNSVLAVEGVTAAQDALVAFTPDVLVTELDLHDGSGFEVTRLIRARHGDGVLVLLTSRLGVAHEVARRAGADGAVQKPLRPDDLVARCVSALRLRGR
jgi:DNA-binding response OmpR family regulator